MHADDASRPATASGPSRRERRGPTGRPRGADRSDARVSGRATRVRGRSRPDAPPPPATPTDVASVRLTRTGIAARARARPALGAPGLDPRLAFVDLSGALTRGARAASTRDRARVTRAHPTHHTRPSATSRGATRAGPNVRGRARSGAPADPDPRLVPPTLGRAHLGRRSGIDPRPRGPPATGRTRTDRK